jgi:predicted ABC-type sugar transport system permease subunit
MIQQTRFKTVLLGLALGLIEGILRAALKDFPVIEVYGFQSAVIGGYFAVKTTSNIKRMKCEEESNFNGIKEK